MRILMSILVLAVAAGIPLQLRADPCGDVNVDTLVDAADVAALQAALANPVGMALSPAGEANCTVIGPEPRPCGIVDVAVLIRELNLPSLAPGVAPFCASSLAGCEVLNAAECLLPYPSTHYMEPAATPTGLRLALTQAGIPPVNGDQLSTAPLNELDGFSPMVQILMHFPQGVDLVASNVSRLLPPSGSAPWIDTRTYDGRSLDADSPSVLIDAGTGERILHWLEPDARANGNPGRQALVMRAGKSLTPGHRYIVAMRDLTAPGAASMVAEAPFAALRDSVITGDPAIEGRRAYFEASIFPVLVADGITRPELVLAFDFMVQSEHQLTHQMLSMRDDAFAWLATVDANPLLTPFNVVTTIENDCNVPGEVVWRQVSGTFDSPLFLTGPPLSTTPQHNVDANDVPVQNGFITPDFSISIPCSVHDPQVASHPIVLGHGLFGRGSDMMGVPSAAGAVGDWTYIAGATDWRGLSGQDFSWVAFQIVGFGNSQLNEFPAFPDRLRQGMLNTLVLGRMMKLGIFDRDPAFQKTGRRGVFPGPGEDMYYYGISLGGVMGTWLAALTPDIERYGLDVPAINFSCLLQRSTQFGLGSPLSFEDLIASIGLTDPMKTILGLQLLHELWVSAEPGGYATHITTDPLVGSGNPAKIMMMSAWLDKQVSNQCTETAARTLGLVSGEGSLQQGLQGIPDSVGPQDSALVMFDTGAFDLFNPAHEPFIPPLANLIPSPVCDPHGDRPAIPAGILQLLAFLQPTGQVENFCTGICDAVDPIEQPPVRCVP